jgi:hypothetical protein
VAARNGLQEQVLRNEQLKLRLARLLRERFGAGEIAPLRYAFLPVLGTDHG